MNRKKIKGTTSKAAKQRLPHLLEQYIQSCQSESGATLKKPQPRLANLAGFCRFLGCSVSELEKLKETAPLLRERIQNSLEDELLNFSPSPTLLNSYLKKRLHYEEEKEEPVTSTSCGEMRLIFEHDIEEDGA